MQEPQDRFTPAEIKELITSGELKLEDLKLLHPEDAKVAARLLERGRSVPFKEGLRPVEDKVDLKHNAKAALGGILGGIGFMAAPELAGLTSAAGPTAAAAASKGSNVEKLSREAFDAVGRGPLNVIKSGATKAISEGDRLTQILFGGLNAAKNAYQSPRRPPVGPQDLLQLIQNIKDVAKTPVAQGVVRRGPAK